MKVKREICVAGKVIDVTVKVPSGNHKNKRSAKVNVTAEKVQKNNDKLAAKNLARLFNANCDSLWWHDTLTYVTEPTEEQAEREINNFVSRLRRACAKIGIELKWFESKEKTSRLHHHFITNAPIEIVREKWNEGYVLPRPLDDGPNYVRLADYIIKETSKTFRDEGSKRKTRFRHSRNLVVPEVKVEYVEEKALFADPVAWKGYFIDDETLRRYEHPITGLEHLEYTMISLDENPRVKKYYKGQKKKRENFKRYINAVEEQLSLLDGLA